MLISSIAAKPQYFKYLVRFSKIEIQWQKDAEWYYLELLSSVAEYEIYNMKYRTNCF